METGKPAPSQTIAPNEPRDGYPAAAGKAPVPSAASQSSSDERKGLEKAQVQHASRAPGPMSYANAVSGSKSSIMHHSTKPSKTQSPEKQVSSTKPSQDQTQRSEQRDKPDQSQISDQSQKADQPQKAEQPQEADQPRMPGQPQKANQPHKPDQSRSPDQFQKAEQPRKADQLRKPEQHSESVDASPIAKQSPTQPAKKQNKKKKSKAKKKQAKYDSSRTASKAANSSSSPSKDSSTDSGSTIIAPGGSDKSDDGNFGVPKDWKKGAHLILTYCCNSLWYRNTTPYKEHLRSKPSKTHHLNFKRDQEIRCCGRNLSSVQAYREHMRSNHRQEKLRWERELHIYLEIRKKLYPLLSEPENLKELQNPVVCCNFSFKDAESLEVHLDNCHNMPDWFTRKEKVEALDQCKKSFDNFLILTRDGLPASEHHSYETYQKAATAFLDATNAIIQGWNTSADLQTRMSFQNGLNQWRAEEAEDWGPMWGNMQVSDGTVHGSGHYYSSDHTQTHYWNQAQNATQGYDENLSPRGRQQEPASEGHESGSQGSSGHGFTGVPISPDQDNHNNMDGQRYYPSEHPADRASEFPGAFVNQLDSLKRSTSGGLPVKTLAHTFQPNANVFQPQHQTSPQSQAKTNRKGHNSKPAHSHEPKTPKPKQKADPAGGRPNGQKSKSKMKRSPEQHIRQNSPTYAQQQPMPYGFNYQPNTFSHNSQQTPFNQFNHFNGQSMVPANPNDGYAPWYSYPQASMQPNAQFYGPAHAYNAGPNIPWSTSPWTGFSAEAQEFVPSLSFGSPGHVGSPAQMGTWSEGSFETNPKEIRGKF